MASITYRFEVRATLPLTTDPDSANFYTVEGATDPKHRRSLEKALAALLKRERFADCADCDVELMDFTIDAHAPHGPDCACETCQHERAADTAQEPKR